MKGHAYTGTAFDVRRRKQHPIDARSAPEIGIEPMPILPGGGIPCP